MLHARHASVQHHILSRYDAALNALVCISSVVGTLGKTITNNRHKEQRSTLHRVGAAQEDIHACTRTRSRCNSRGVGSVWARDRKREHLEHVEEHVPQIIRTVAAGSAWPELQQVGAAADGQRWALLLGVRCACGDLARSRTQRACEHTHVFMLIGTAPNECSLTWYTVMFTAYAGSILGAAAAAAAAANARASIMKTMMPETMHPLRLIKVSHCVKL
jgi:hypothetical protein